MSDYQDRNLPSKKSSVLSKLHICLFSTQSQFAQSVIKLLYGDRYKIESLTLIDELIDFVTQNQEQLDCILLIDNNQLDSILRRLCQLEILLPTVIINTEPSAKTIGAKNQDSNSLIDLATVDSLYHQAEVLLYPTQLKEIDSYINLAITKFIKLSPNSENTARPKNELKSQKNWQSSLTNQQRRLTEKIKERLGYLGFYYKRNSNDFYRKLASKQQKKLQQELSLSYRKILLDYFDESSQINKLIDDFVDRAFFADISTSQILEIHMELIDEFSYQLQIEGRNDDILLDYRLPLIDVTAHLCEMYRRSIPGDEISLELLFKVE